MTTLQEALQAVGLADGKFPTKSQTITPEPTAPAQSGLPKWLTRNGRRDGAVRELINPLATHKAWLIHPSNQHYNRIVAVEPIDDRFAWVSLEGEEVPRKFRLDAVVRYVLATK